MTKIPYVPNGYTIRVGISGNPPTELVIKRVDVSLTRGGYLGELFVAVELPYGYGPTEDEPQAPYHADAAQSAKMPDEPHTIIGQGDTARHLRT
jgi:hypothetical protein